MTMEACAICPHQSDCSKVGSCLDETMKALRAGRTLRRICGGGKFGPAIASLTKFRKHCKLYPEWGAEAKRLAIANEGDGQAERRTL